MPRGESYTLAHFPDPPDAALSERTAVAMQAVLDAALERRLPAVTATVMVAGLGVWSGAAGTADGVHPVEVDSQFAVGSITKNVVAAEIMLLAEDGLLNLSDPVSDHLPPELAFDTNGATVEDLLAMGSGIPEPALLDGPGMETDPLREWTPAEMLASVPLHRAERSSNFSYSNTNFLLLGLVIEQIRGTSVAVALRSHLTADPRLATLVYQPEERPAGPLALPFRGGVPRPDILELGGGYLATKASASAGAGLGCIASDSAALALWGYLLFGGHLISEESVVKMADFGGDLYGLGTWDLTTAAGGFGTAALGHGGWDPGGYSATMVVLPARGIVVSVLTNTGGDSWNLVVPVARELIAALEE